MKSKKVVKLCRSGEFRTQNLIEGDQKCGPLGKHYYDFTCEVWVKERRLDKMGFVCDTNALAALIEQRFQPETPREYPSCEQMAVELNSAIKRELVPNALRVRVRVYPLNDRYVESDRRY